jgi:peptidoglycan hydrolase CwlO-like protein
METMKPDDKADNYAESVRAFFDAAHARMAEKKNREPEPLDEVALLRSKIDSLYEKKCELETEHEEISHDLAELEEEIFELEDALAEEESRLENENEKKD